MYRDQLYLRRRRYRTETSSSGFIEAGLPSWGLHRNPRGREAYRIGEDLGIKRVQNEF
jgi:hypothetical protein